MENKKATEATLYLYDEIGYWGIDAKQFVDDLNEIDADVIHLRINSPGGDVFAAKAMQTALKQHKAKIVTHVDGLAASAASVVALAGDEIEMVDGGFFMIHKALSFFDVLGYFNDEALAGLVVDMEKEKELLAKVDDSIAKDYAKRTGHKVKDIKGLMSAETWFTAEEAVGYGLIDRVYDGEPVENKYDLSIFANAPDIGKVEGLTKREIERTLRDAGCSQNMAKSIMSKGWVEEGTQRDAESLEPRIEDTLTVVATVEPIQREADVPKNKYDLLLEKAEVAFPTLN